MTKRLLFAGGLALCVVLSTGCATRNQTVGTAVGAGGGALIGQAIGGNTAGTLIGAGAGALAGNIVGREMDDRDRRQRHHHRGY